jgi:hypothetical protein
MLAGCPKGERSQLIRTIAFVFGRALSSLSAASAGNSFDCLGPLASLACPPPKLTSRLVNFHWLACGSGFTNPIGDFDGGGSAEQRITLHPKIPTDLYLWKAEVCRRAAFGAMAVRTGRVGLCPPFLPSPNQVPQPGQWSGLGDPCREWSPSSTIPVLFHSREPSIKLPVPTLHVSPR